MVKENNDDVFTIQYRTTMTLNEWIDMQVWLDDNNHIKHYDLKDGTYLIHGGENATYFKLHWG